MQTIILILTIAYIANLHTHLFDYQPYINFKIKYLNYKIFNCSKCFAFWISLPLTFFLFPMFYSISISLVISLVAAIIEKILFQW